MHLAHFSYGRAVAPNASPEMAEFVGALDRINDLADRSPGFIWRYQNETGHAIDTVIFDDPQLILSLDVWTDVQSLHDFVYRSAHAGYLRRRRNWFEAPNPDEPYIVLWWVPEGHRPDIAESEAKMRELVATGPTPSAFTFRHRFEHPLEQKAT